MTKVLLFVSLFGCFFPLPGVGSSQFVIIYLGIDMSCFEASAVDASILQQQHDVLFKHCFGKHNFHGHESY